MRGGFALLGRVVRGYVSEFGRRERDPVTGRGEHDEAVTPGGDCALGVPAFNGGRRNIAELRGHGPDATELLEDTGQEPLRDDCVDVRLTHSNRTFGVRQSHSSDRCENRMMAAMKPDQIVAELQRLRVPHDAIASVIGRDRTAATKMLAGKRSVKFNEVEGLTKLVNQYRGASGSLAALPTIPVVPPIKVVVRRIPMVGDVEAGVWRETVARERHDIDEYLPIDVPGYERADLRAMRVIGPSMNQHYPPGRFVVIAPTAEAGLREGDHVVVERRRGSMTEITLKEYVVEPNGRVALWPRSDHPDFQQPYFLKISDESDQDGVEVTGVVVADYRKRERPRA